MRPKVSIVMPVLNGEKYIAEAVGSILAQTYTDYELIVVDDGSTDGTPALIERFANMMRLKCVRHPQRQGIARSVNDGIRAAAGEYIAFLDHDDLWFPDFLQVQTGYLEGHPEAGMVHSDFQTVDAAGNVIESSVKLCRNRQRPSGSVFRRLFMDSFIVGNSVLIRKECFDRLGVFDEVLRWGDYHMWLRIALHYRVDYMDKVLTKYRQHSTQGTREVSARDPREEPVPAAAINRLLEQYPEVRGELGETTIRRRMGSFYFDQAFAWWEAGEPGIARSGARRALRSWPANPKYLKLYFACMLPKSLARAMQRALRAVRRSAPHDAAQHRLERAG
jgi:glycosyltransferase involved in cell wall biosynthesis